MKGDILPDHMPISKYQLLFLGLPSLTATEVSGIEEELDTTELPDKTTASGGKTKPTEFTFKHPMHHTIEQVAMEAWYLLCKDPVSPLYKKEGTLIHYSNSGNVLRTYSIVGAYPSKRSTPDLDMGNEGEMAAVEWTIKVDELLPI
jgi:hypothetical protein